MKRYLPLIPALAVAFAAACDQPTMPSLSPDEGVLFGHDEVSDSWDGGPLRGAIWNTIRDGSIVDGTTVFDFKTDVYIKGGPQPNAPAFAAGLNDGIYVFQVTDPSGKELLSQSPAKCRMFQVAGGQIVHQVRPDEIPHELAGALSNTYDSNLSNGQSTWIDCHDPDPLNGQHSTGPHPQGGITIQLMPFLDTPNPGGVYKTWVTPAEVYIARGGGLDNVPGSNGVQSQVRVRGTTIGFVPDKGFGPPRSNIKTDNFKVEGVPPRIIVEKWDDVHQTGDIDLATDEKIVGWPVLVFEPVNGYDILHENFTPFAFNAVPGTTVKVCELDRDGWGFSFAQINGNSATTTSITHDDDSYICVEVEVGQSDTEILVAFGNFEFGTKSGLKFHDLNATGVQDEGDLGLQNWAIHLFKHDGTEYVFEEEALTVGAGGGYTFDNLGAGDYRVCEVLKEDWLQSLPHTTTTVPAGETLVTDCNAFDDANTTYGQYGYGFTVVSGASFSGNDFGNYQLVDVNGTKFRADPAGTLQGWEIHLILKGPPGVFDEAATTAANGTYSFTGLMPGTTFVVCEVMQDGWVQTAPGDEQGTVDCSQYNNLLQDGKVYGPRGYEFTPVSGTNIGNLDFTNEPTGSCTPGFWRNWTGEGSGGQQDAWIETGYTRDQIFDVVFGTNLFDADFTLFDAIQQGGGDLNRLARHGTAALLNAAHPYVGYPLTVAEVIAAVQAGNTDLLAGLNEDYDCPLGQDLW